MNKLSNKPETQDLEFMTWKLKKRKRKSSIKREIDSNAFQRIYSNTNFNRQSQLNNFFPQGGNALSSALTIKNR